MTQLIFFHHALGLTDSVHRFADTLRHHGHEVTTPDLYDGHVFTDLSSGLAYVDEIGMDTLLARAEAALDGLPQDVVLGGQSLGVMAAQHLIQTRGAAGALFVSAFIEPTQLSGTWPGIPTYIFASSGDEFFVGDGDHDAAKRAAEQYGNITINLFDSDDHLLNEAALGCDTDAVEWLDRAALEALNAFG